MRWIMAAFYAIAGIVHLMRRRGRSCRSCRIGCRSRARSILVTGVCELAGAAALLTLRLRWLAGVMLALYALCVWPANIKQAVEHIVLPSIPDTWWYHGPRLAFQPVLIWWALFCAGVDRLAVARTQRSRRGL